MTNDYANAYQTKALTLSIELLSHCHTHDDAQIRTTHNISHIPSMTNDLRKCAPNKSSTLSIFYNSHTHDVIYANAYHTQNITHTVHQDYAVCHTHIRI